MPAKRTSHVLQPALVASAAEREPVAVERTVIADEPDDLEQRVALLEPK